MLVTKPQVKVVPALKLTSVICGLLFIGAMERLEWANEILKIFYWRSDAALNIFMFSLILNLVAYLILKLLRRGNPLLMAYSSLAWLINWAIVFFFPGGIPLYTFVTVPLVFFATTYSFLNYYNSFKYVQA